VIASLIPPTELGTPPMSQSPFALLPTASNHAQSLDNLYIFITVLCVISMIGIIGAQIYFMVKYRQVEKGQKTDPLTHNTMLEFVWSAIPGIFLIMIFVWGELGYMAMVTPPADAIPVKITGQKWLWTIEYPQFPGGPSLTCPRDEKTCANEVKTPTLFVPLNKPVELTMTSVDVIHSFYIPAFRVKKDVVPGRYTTLWFTAIKEGEYPIFCTEYCGDEHSAMLAKVIVVPEDEWAARVKNATKLKQEDGETPAAYGQRLFTVMGCPACHSVDGSPKVGPSLKGLWEKEESLSDGSTVKVDANYIKNSILEPNSQVVAGYSPQMPSFQGKLSQDQLDAIIEYIKTVK
jgi:cytochrome c oxidase subunit 2